MDAGMYFKGKKVTLMGLGLLGRGVGDAEFLARHGAELIVTDLKSEQDLASSIERLKRFSNIKFVLGEHRLEDFRGRDFILKAAGVSLDSPFIAEAKKNNIPAKIRQPINDPIPPANSQFLCFHLFKIRRPWGAIRLHHLYSRLMVARFKIL